MMKFKPEIIKILLKCGVFNTVFVITGLILIQNSFGQAGPVRLKGSGGNTVTEINISGTWYEVHSYTTTGASTFTPPSGASSVEYLVVAGGGGGGGITNTNNIGGAGGGGAGGFLTNVGGTGFSVSVPSYAVSVGAGGTAGVGGSSQGGSGGTSSFSTISATGGGGGASSGVSNNGVNGGSGGGSRISGTGGTGTAGQGNSGANNGGASPGSGGGGAGSAGSAGGASNGGPGGSGSGNFITGAAITYATGGSGGNFGTRTGGTAGTVNTGNGGQGATGSSGSGSAFNGGTGGSGIVIIRYKAPTMAITTQPSVIVSAGSNFAQPVVIQILDGTGLAVSGIVVTASLQSGTGGTLSNNTATTDASGNATFTNLQLSGPPTNVYTLNFQVPGSGNMVVSNTINLCGVPLSTITAHSDITCNGNADGTITVTASGGASPYTFSINNGIYVGGNTANSNVFTGLAPDTPYQIKVKDNNGCISK
jgi:hypothetical protein